MTMDPRMAARRVRVAEGRAKNDVRRVLWLAGVATLVGGVVWLLASPYLSVQRVITHGVQQAAVEEILVDQGVVHGRPLIAIRSSSVAAHLVEDPWVKDASVELVFPDLVEVTVIERESGAWLDVGGRWAHVADDGVVVGYAPSPPPDAPIVRVSAADPGIGQQLEGDLATGAVAFVGALPINLSEGLVLRHDAGDMWATVAGRPVRLGTAVDMVAKAAAVAALLEVSDSGVIDVIAPSRPAIWSDRVPEDASGVPVNIQDEVEGEG